MNLENMPRRTKLIAGGGAAVLLAAWLAFSPYYAAQQWSHAMQTKDMATAQAWMDSESIRAHLEAEMEAKAKLKKSDPSNAMEAMGKMMAAAVIQAMSTPQGLLDMVDMARQMSAMMNEGQNGKPALDVSTLTGETEYRSPLRFVLRVKQGDKPLYNVVFHRRWLTWRMAEITEAKDELPGADAVAEAKPTADTPLSVGGDSAAPEQDCRYLFEDMYLPYVRGNDMQSRCAESGLTEVSGMSTVRAWNEYSGDPRFNLPAMEQLTAETCRSGAEVSWPQFRQQVCGG